MREAVGIVGGDMRGAGKGVPVPDTLFPLCISDANTAAVRILAPDDEMAPVMPLITTFKTTGLRPSQNRAERKWNSTWPQMLAEGNHSAIPDSRPLPMWRLPVHHRRG